MGGKYAFSLLSCLLLALSHSLQHCQRDQGIEAKILQPKQKRAMRNQIMRCLEEMNNGRSLPSYVIIDPDLSAFNGTFLAEGSMLLYFSGENPRENITRFGHWKPISNDQNSFTYPTVGRRMGMRFYLGHAPEGERTYCLMHEYKILIKDPQGNYTLQDSSSLCQIFWETPGSYEGHRDYVYDQLSLILANEGTQQNVQDSFCNGQMMNGDGPLPGRELMDDQEMVDVIEGDFLELNDL